MYILVYDDYDFICLSDEFHNATIHSMVLKQIQHAIVFLL